MTETCPWGRSAYGTTVPGISRLNYHHLPDRLKDTYLAVDEMLSNRRRRTAVISDIGRSEVMDVLHAVKLDNPYAFGFKGVNIARVPSATELIPRYTIGKKEWEACINRVEGRFDEIEGSITRGKAFDKECSIHDLMTASVVYSKDHDSDFDITGPLLHGRGSCQGISIATSYLLNRMGIDAGCIGGWENSEWVRHAWNIVSLDSRNYHLDVTYDLSGYHRFVNLDDAVALRGRRHRMPIVCDGTSWNYHRVHGMVVRSPDDASHLANIVLKRRMGLLEISHPSLDCQVVIDEIVRSGKRDNIGLRIRWSDDPMTDCCSIEIDYR